MSKRNRNSPWPKQLSVFTLTLCLTLESMKLITPYFIEFLKPSQNMVEFLTLCLKNAQVIIYAVAPILAVIGGVGIAFGWRISDKKEKTEDNP